MDRFIRQVYASAKSKVEAAIGAALLENRHLIRADGEVTPEQVQDALDQGVGDALTDVISDVNDTMPQIAAEMMDEEDEAEGEGEEEFAIEEGSDDEDEDDLPVADDDDDEVDTDEMEAVASSLVKIKRGLLKQASRLAKDGDIDNSARLRMMAKKL